jgi:hypothetical protein
MANALTFSSWGRKIGIEVKSPVYIPVSLPPKSDAVLYAGRPVTLNANGEVVPVASNTEVLGLVKCHKNQYSNEVSDDYGMYGSGLVTVIVSGLVEIAPNYFTAADGSETVVANYEDDFLSASLMAKVYVNVTKGTLTTTVANGTNEKTFVGYLLRRPTTDDPRCLILLK